MNKENYIVVSIGTNYCQQENMYYAKKKLSIILGEQATFTQELWTAPIGIDSDKFLNCICIASTKHTMLQLHKAFKKLERQCGRSKKNDSEKKIPLDIDILFYGDEKFHIQDWNRDYVKILLSDFFDVDGRFIIDPNEC